jgi:hypothetical protein
VKKVLAVPANFRRRHIHAYNQPHTLAHSRNQLGSTLGFYQPCFSAASDVCIFNLVVGNISYLLFYLVTCLDKKDYKAVPLALVMPAYWVLISVAAWRGLLQLITKPFYWEKTLQGVSKGAEKKPH